MDDTRPERTLVLLRHGKSDWSGGEPDPERPLAPRGRRQAAEAGRWLATHLDHLDLAVVSPARRTLSTWALASAELPAAPPLTVDDRVYESSGSGLLRVVRGLPSDLHTVVLVGHNPGLEDLVTLLTESWIALPTSALALVAISDPWADAGSSSARLLASGRPPRPS